MKVTVRELLKSLLEKCDLDAEVKICRYFADELDAGGKEDDYWKAGYNEDGSFEISVIDNL